MAPPGIIGPLGLVLERSGHMNPSNHGIVLANLSHVLRPPASQSGTGCWGYYDHAIHPADGLVVAGRLSRHGDARWRLLLAEHNEAVRNEIDRFGGREAQTTGDGFLVLFDSPARAVRGAAAMIDASADHGLTSRAGIHAGEVELQGDEVRGIAVHAAARILGVSQPGEVLVSATVRDLLSGSGLAFADRGEFELRGFDGRRSLAALVR